MKVPNKYLRISDFNYDLPEDRIAKYPLSQRNHSKLLVYNENEIITDSFKNLNHYLPASSSIIANDSKVVQARLKFKKKSGAHIEVFVLDPVNEDSFELAFIKRKTTVWNCFVGNAKRWKNESISINEILLDNRDCVLNAKRLHSKDGTFQIEFDWSPQELNWGEIIEIFGQTPLPPYLNRESEDADIDRYQTKYAILEGSVAAPTAGLHFTDAMLQDLESKGHEFKTLTLHVGAGTFKPVSSDSINEHEMHTETFIVREELIQYLLSIANHDLIAVGTTSMRALESLYYVGCNLIEGKANPLMVFQWQPYEKEYVYTLEKALKELLAYMKREDVDAFQAYTQIMIVPGFEFRIVKQLITNFHQPKSTLLLLVSAFIGDRWKDTYQYAMDNEFRFLSYGDSCFLSRD